MKKVMMLLLLGLSISAAVQAQTEATTKVKPATTPTQKVHNTFSRHKRSNGVKVKTKTDGHKSVTETAPATIKTKEN